MQKRAIYSILSVVVAMVVLSVTMVLAIGPHVSAMSEHDRILVIDDWEDFEFRSWGNYVSDDARVCYRLSDNVGCGALGYGYYSTCGYFGDEHWDKLDEYDEIHVIFPDGIETIDGHVFETWFNTLGGKISYIKIPQSVKHIGREMLYGCYAAKVYCECSEEYANENWALNWDFVGNGFTDYSNGEYINNPVVEVVWNCNKTITFDTQDGSAVENQKVCVDSLVTKPADPEKAGYTFKGWYNGDEAYDFTTPVSEDMTLTAQWEEITTEPENTDTDTEVNNQNNMGLIWGIAGTSAGVLVIGGIVFGIVISKRRRK